MIPVSSIPTILGNLSLSMILAIAKPTRKMKASDVNTKYTSLNKKLMTDCEKRSQKSSAVKAV